MVRVSAESVSRSGLPLGCSHSSRCSIASSSAFVRRRAKTRLALVDLSGLAERQKQIKLEQISKRDAAQSFDLEKPPLLRTKLLRCAEARHILLVTTHHMISDQASMDVFRTELAALYDAFSRELPSPLGEPGIQFADFARWQRESIGNGMFQPQIAYWLKQLGTPARPFELRRGGTRKRAIRFRSARRPIAIREELFASVKEFAREHNCTPFMVLAAALSLLLHRHSGSRDIRIGTLAANRSRAGTEGLIGYFVNALVLRVRIRPRMSCAELIAQVRATTVAAYAHQDLPFEHLESLLEARQAKQTPPYQVMLNYRNQHTPAIEANGLTVGSWNDKRRAENPGIAISRLAVSFHLRELPTRVTGVVDYKADLFDDAAIAKFLEDYLKIINQIVVDENGPVSERTVDR